MGMIEHLRAIAETRQERPSEPGCGKAWLSACDACAGNVINTADVAQRRLLVGTYTALCQVAERDAREVGA